MTTQAELNRAWNKRHIWRAGDWYTVKPNQNIAFYTETFHRVLTRGGDVLQYKGCKMVDQGALGVRLMRIFSLNGIHLYTNRYCDGYLEKN